MSIEKEKDKIGSYQQTFSLVSRITGLVLIILTVALCYMRYEHLLHKLYVYERVNSPSFKEPVYPGMTLGQAVNVGGGHSESVHPSNSYLLFDKRKTPGVIRIGVFGGSFVQGAEAAYGHDFPTLLQKRFERAGVENIEVINFGLGGRGVHPMYLLWQYVGQRYELDYVVMMPYLFHTTRDESFTHNYGYNPVYARYILEGDKIRLISVAGDSVKQAVEIYHRFVPPWRYIRYDNKMPMFLRVLLPARFHNLTNPIYYKLRKFNKDEILITYSILFAELAKQVDRLIIWTNASEIYDLREKVNFPSVYFLKTQERRPNSLYRAPKGHRSALGNQMIADELFSLLTGHDRPELRVVEISVPTDRQETRAVSASPLHGYKAVSVSVGSHSIGSFVSGINKFYFEGRGDDVNFEEHKIASLILSEDLSWHNEIRFIPFASRLKDGTPVYLSFTAFRREFRFPIGSIRAQSGVFGRLVLSLPAEMDGDDGSWHIEIKKRNIVIKGNDNVKNVRLIADDRLFMKGSQSSEEAQMFLLSPALFDYIYLRGKARQFLDVHNFEGEKGNVDSVVVDGEGSETRFPLFSYRIKEVESVDFEPFYFDTNSLHNIQ